jgi:hypothetical protein
VYREATLILGFLFSCGIGAPTISKTSFNILMVAIAVVVVLKEELLSLVVGGSDKARIGEAIVVEFLREEEHWFMVSVGFRGLGGSNRVHVVLMVVLVFVCGKQKESLLTGFRFLNCYCSSESWIPFPIKN